ncbi:MAG: hypothetical protein IT483_15735 [Gammaproteobacteria bacterium]|nr:hypothetical protein [Gammaproteobacteria bacterium]
MKPITQRDELEELEQLRQSGRGVRTVSDRKVIENVLQLANMRDGNWTDFANVYVSLELRPGTVFHKDDGEAAPDIVRTFVDERAGATWRELFAADFVSYTEARDRLMPMLVMIQKNIARARRELPAKIAQHLNGVVVVAFARFHDGQLVMEPRPYLPDIDVAVAYAIALLLDNSRPAGDRRTFGARLRRCALGTDPMGTSCEKWFLSFATAQGGPMPKYCCPEHRDAAARATVAERVAKHRARHKPAKPK